MRNESNATPIGQQVLVAAVLSKHATESMSAWMATDPLLHALAFMPNNLCWEGVLRCQQRSTKCNDLELQKTRFRRWLYRCFFFARWCYGKQHPLTSASSTFCHVWSSQASRAWEREAMWKLCSAVDKKYGQHCVKVAHGAWLEPQSLEVEVLPGPFLPFFFFLFLLCSMAPAKQVAHLRKANEGIRQLCGLGNHASDTESTPKKESKDTAKPLCNSV